jgi:hypothetical protein
MSGDRQELAGPEPEPYFAPTQIKKRNSDWGPVELTRRLNEVERLFISGILACESTVDGGQGASRVCGGTGLSVFLAS